MASHDERAIGDAVALWHRVSYCWTNLIVWVVPIAGGDAKVRTGNAPSIFRKQSDASWVLIRDANMLSSA